MELIIILLIPILLNTLSINDRLNKIIELLERKINMTLELAYKLHNDFGYDIIIKGDTIIIKTC